jgi:hypothetical protein
VSKKLTNEDLCRAARRIVATTAEVQTFLAVETKGRGFDDQERVIILFERHWFHKLTGGIYDKDHPEISNPRPGGYNVGGSQHERFSTAFALDPQAAMKAASWGIGQVMGFNYAICGYPSVDAFVDAMKESEGKQLDAAIEFICHNNLDDELRTHNWKGFARGYNGANYAINNYDGKLASAYKTFSNHKIDCTKASAELAGDPANVTSGDERISADEQGEQLNDPTLSSIQSSTAQPATDQDTTAAVKVTETSDTTTTEVTAAPGHDPSVPATQVSQNGGFARNILTGSTATAVGGAVLAWATNHVDGVAVIVICITVIVLAVLFRGTIIDAIRMQTAADPKKYNVK